MLETNQSIATFLQTSRSSASASTTTGGCRRCSQAVTLEDVKAAAAEVLHPDRAAIAASPVLNRDGDAYDPQVFIDYTTRIIEGMGGSGEGVEAASRDCTTRGPPAITSRSTTMCPKCCGGCARAG